VALAAMGPGIDTMGTQRLLRHMDYLAGGRKTIYKRKSTERARMKNEAAADQLATAAKQMRAIHESNVRRVMDA